MRVFVYGTLKRGYGNHRILGNSRLIGSARTVDKFIMLSPSFPVVMVPYSSTSRGAAKIRGELYQVRSERVLNALDRLEGVPRMYTREVVRVKTPGNEYVDAFMYVGTGAYWSKCDHLATKNAHGEFEWFSRIVYDTYTRRAG